MKPFMKSVNWPKPGYASITCSTISNIFIHLIFTTKFNDSSILITIISCDYLNLSLMDEHVGFWRHSIEYNLNVLQSDWNIQIKLNYLKMSFVRTCIQNMIQPGYIHTYLKNKIVRSSNNLILSSV